ECQLISEKRVPDSPGVHAGGTIRRFPCLTGAFPMPATLRLILLGSLFALPVASAAEPKEEVPIRIASDVSGHIHPAACVTKKGTVFVIFGKRDYKDLKLTRSADGGKTWTEPVAFEHTEKLDIYPGSLTALKDGRVIHAWNTWYKNDKGQ